MADFSSVGTTSYGGRFMQTLGGAVLGVIIFLVAFPLLFWNEGRAVRDAKRLEEGSKSVVTADPEKVDPANQGKEVCVSGSAVPSGTLDDPAFDIHATGLALHREVEMYQWKETSHEEKKVGGSSETTYSYDRTWSSSKINSTGFHSHKTNTGEPIQNPGNWQYQSKTTYAPAITVGAFKLSEDLIKQITPQETLPPTGGSTSAPSTTTKPTTEAVLAGDPDSDDSTKPAASMTGYTIDGDKYYVGEDAKHPEIGDMRVAFKIAKPQPVTVVAQQSGGTFVPYMTREGSIAMLRLGNHTAGEMFAMARADAAMLTWILRLVGFILIAAGIAMALKPLTMAVGILPFLEGIADMATGLVAILGATVLTLLTISIAWLFYRPLIGIGLLVLAGGAAFLLFKARKNRPGAMKPAAA